MLYILEPQIMNLYYKEFKHNNKTNIYRICKETQNIVFNIKKQFNYCIIFRF